MAEAPGAASGTESGGGRLDRAASIAFLLLAAALPWSVAPISITLVLAAALTVAIWWRPGGPRWVRTPVDLPALGWIVALALAATFAEDPSASWPRVTKGLLLLLVPVAAYHAREEAAARRAVFVLFLSAGAAAIYALARFAAQGPEFPNRVKGLVGHPLTYGGQALLIASLAGAVAARCSGRARWGAMALLALLLPALAGTYTRSAWIGFVLAASIVVAFTRARWLPALASALLVAAVTLSGAYRERALSTLDPMGPWNRERVYMWEAGWRMLRDHPWTGVGLQDLHGIYEHYRNPAAREGAGHLHSVYVHVGATMGVIGLSALVALIAGLSRAASRGFTSSRRGFGGAVSLGVSAGIAGFFAAGLMEWNLGDEELLDLLCVLTGIAFASGGWSAASPVPAPAPSVSPSGPARSGGDTTPPSDPGPRAGAPAGPSRA